MRLPLPKTVLGLACVACGRETPADGARLTCRACGENLDVRYDYALVAREIDPRRLREMREPSLWRYRPLLPLHESSGPPPLRVGGRPLLRAARLGERIGVPRLYLHDDTGNPTASFKDRASLVAALRGREMGAETIATASTGNAASSLAGIAAALGMRAVIFVPENAPAPKLTQMLLYGARVFRVRGTYDDAFDLCLAATERFGWYTRSTGVNPFTVEGKKTAAFEIAESLAWKAPDWVLVPTGDGNILGGVGKGFLELRRLGWIDRAPRLAAVQAAGSAAIANAWRAGEAVARPVVAETVADSISVGFPRDSRRALGVLRETEGVAITVPDEEILAAMRELPAATGVFAEPSAAAALAGLRTLVREEKIGAEQTVVLLVTGNGLKDVATASRLVPAPPVVDPDLADVERKMAG
jgi:threonine synthase